MKRKILNFLYDYSELVAFVIFLLLVLIAKILDYWILYVLGFILFIQYIWIMRVYTGCYDKNHNDQKSKGICYPANQECSPKYFKRLFKLAHFNINRVPIVAVQHMYTEVILSIIFDIGFLLALIIGADIIIAFLVILYIPLSLAILIFFLIKARMVSFVWKFKKVSWKNIGYLLRRMVFTDASDKEPSLVMLGKCKIITVKNRRKYTYAEVQMLRNGIVYKNVLLLGKKNNDADKILKEISGIKFID